MKLTAESVNSIVANLASITTQNMAENTSILPLDIKATTFVLNASLQ